MRSGKSYVPLWVKSNHSFLEGASHPEELVDQSAAFSLPAMALTDRDGLYGAVKAHVRCKERGVRLLVGSELTISTKHATELDALSVDERTRESFRIVVLARDLAGYSSLCRLISKGRGRSPKGSSILALEELCAIGGERLVVLCADADPLPWLKEAFGKSLYAAIARHLREEEVVFERGLRRAAKSFDVACVAAPEILYHDSSRRPLCDVLTCIRHGTTLSKAGTQIRANAEHALRSIAEMNVLYSGDESMIDRTLEIADKCDFSYTQIVYRYPSYSSEGTSERERLRIHVMEGASVRYPEGITDRIRAQLEDELSVIEDLSFDGYFLTMHEIVQFCRSQRILCQGRGSAANSAVCFCLGITAIDPFRNQLFFERFLSRERAEPPDIDLDIEHERREEVIQWVYSHYGRRHAAMVANLIRYRLRSAVRDVGKVLGVPETEIDGIARLLAHYDDAFGAGTLIAAGLSPEKDSLRLLMDLCNQILDFPRHLSIHPGGFLLGHTPVDELVPVEPATMEGRTVIQWDKYDIESLCLFKVDLLGLGSLTAIRRTLALLSAHKNIEMNMDSVQKEDPRTYEMISRGDTVGVFQIESRAQMSMLPRLKPNTFYDLVIEVAIVRPGPIQGDMVHPYLRRRMGQEQVVYPHPALEEVLGRTLGVPIFQEQVMKVAVLVAGYSAGESDQLRRDMAAWNSSGKIEQHRERLIEGMCKSGLSKEFAERVFSQIRGFGEYGFPESHAMSFALITYMTSWLRCHHHDAFVCGMLNSQPMGFYSPSTLISDAQRNGVVVMPIDVRESEWDCTLERHAKAPSGWAVRMGLRYVRGFGSRERQALGDANARRTFCDERRDAPRTLEDFVRAHPLPLASQVALAEAGGFDSFAIGRRDAIWLIRASSRGASDRLESSPRADVPYGFEALSDRDEIVWDHQIAQHSARGHPLSHLRELLDARRIWGARKVRECADGRRIDCAGLVICRQRPGTASGVVFMTLEDEDGFINIVVWADVFDRFRVVARTAILLGVQGRVQVADSVVHVVAERLYVPDLSAELAPHASNDFRLGSYKSRDFH